MNNIEVEKNYVEISPEECVEEVVITSSTFFYTKKISLRKVHGDLFQYKKNEYIPISECGRKIKKVFMPLVLPYFNY
jgi:hypothetical protein